MHVLSSSLTCVWRDTLQKTTSIHSWKFIPLVEILRHPTIFRVLIIIIISFEVYTLCNLWLQYSIEIHSIFTSLNIGTNWYIRVVLLLLQLLSMRKINIDCFDLFLLPSIILQEICCLNRCSSDGPLVISSTFIFLIDLIDILDQWFIDSVVYAFLII